MPLVAARGWGIPRVAARGCGIPQVAVRGWGISRTVPPKNSASARASGILYMVSSIIVMDPVILLQLRREWLGIPP
jgi:hypothetical protein